MKRLSTNRACCVAILTLCLWLAPQAKAEEDAPLSYQGAYWGLQGHTGIVLPPDLGDGGAVGLTYGASARLATLASLLDVQATLMAAHYTRGGAGGEALAVDRLSLGLEIHGHPLLTLVLRSDFLFQWLAGLYASVGLDLDMAHVDGEWHTGPAVKIGGGSDIALTDPDRGWGVWLGVSYHAKVLSPRVPGLGALDEHVLLVTLAYRNNDSYFARVPRPEEIQYRVQPLDD